MKFDFYEAAKKNVLVVAHRGVAGGNIPCNTIASYEIALKQGADVIETDVEMSVDGNLFVFHPGMESSHLFYADRLKKEKASVIEKLHYVNYDRSYTQFTVEKFDDLLETFKDRCFINVDKFWGHPQEIYSAIKKHGMTDQIVVKSAPKHNVLDCLEQLSPELQFMPIVRDDGNPVHKMLCERNINYIGAEVLFTEDDSPAASREFIDMMHRDGKLVWANAIIYNYKEQLSAGHSDDTALTKSPEEGWGWLADHGFDFIQTDWTGMLVDFLRHTGRYYR